MIHIYIRDVFTHSTNASLTIYNDEYNTNTLPASAGEKKKRTFLANLHFFLLPAKAAVTAR